MEPGSLPHETKVPRKPKFIPKAPPRKLHKFVAPKVEKTESTEEELAKARELYSRHQDSSVRVKAKDEKLEVAFSYQGGGATSSRFKGIYNGMGANAFGVKAEKEYKEPWDYYKNYPTSLPLRRPYSGNPEPLNEAEFGEASASLAYNEHAMKPAVDLGLMDEDLGARLILLQLPAVMPMVKQSAVAEEKGPNPPRGLRHTKRLCSINELPAGFMGKLLVYRSGAVKLRLGDTLYDVSGGLDCVFAQDVVAINSEKKQCCTLGEIGKRAVVTPDIDSLSTSMQELL